MFDYTFTEVICMQLVCWGLLSTSNTSLKCQINYKGSLLNTRIFHSPPLRSTIAIEDW